MVTFSASHHAPLSLWEFQSPRTFGPPTGVPQDEACGKGLVIALDLPKSWHPA